jgi:FtsZ-binding cell division protein ZapB
LKVYSHRRFDVMWFTFAEGYERISVERQEFGTELITADGRHCFRAPDHFAPNILAIKGFAILKDVPEGAPDDLPKADPLRDSAIALLSGEKEALKRENQDLRTDLGAATAKIAALVREKSNLEAQVVALQQAVDDLKEELEDAGKEPLVAEGPKAKGK